MYQPKGIMLDLETLGTEPGCAILSIGACTFDVAKEEVGTHEFHVVIDAYSCFKVGLICNPNTKQWWTEQSDQAINETYLPAMTGLGASTVPLKEALLSWYAWYKSMQVIGYENVWGNGSTFDNIILIAAWDIVNARLETPIPCPLPDNRKDRDYRTLKEIAPFIQIARQGTYHNALDDAKSQAIHLLRICEFINVAYKHKY